MSLYAVVKATSFNMQSFQLFAVTCSLRSTCFMNYQVCFSVKHKSDQKITKEFHVHENICEKFLLLIEFTLNVESEGVPVLQAVLFIIGREGSI